MMISFSEFLEKQKSGNLNEESLKAESKNQPIEEKFEQTKTVNENSKTSEEIEHKKEDLYEVEQFQTKREELIKEFVDIAPTGYKIFRDKSESFICDMEITGANPQNSKARIILESSNLTYMFEGTIDSQGKCKIPLKKMNFLNENETGIIKLEVIADDTVFTPWEDNFVAVNSKKVSVKVFESSDDNSSKVGVKIRSIR